MNNEKITIELDNTIAVALAEAVLDRIRYLQTQAPSKERDEAWNALLAFSRMMRDKLMQKQKDGLN